MSHKDQFRENIPDFNSGIRKWYIFRRFARKSTYPRNKNSVIDI